MYMKIEAKVSTAVAIAKKYSVEQSSG